MITHCPSCQTYFRVRAEQLATRAGQVRCGKCDRIFDALENLTEEGAPSGLSSAARESASIGAATVAAEPALASVPADFAPAAAKGDSADQQQPAIPTYAASADVETAALQIEAGVSAAMLPDAIVPEPVPAQPAGDETGNAYDFGPIAAADPATRARRWPWLLGTLLLLLVLLAQAAYYYRSALIVLVPEAKPYAAKLCASLGCELPLPQRIKQMSIEASDLQADSANPNVMVLSATLKNRAIFQQQFPLLELTLTDAQDQPLVRRVLAPQDYIGAAADTQAGFAAVSEIAIKVFIEGSQVKATGYRLYLFYP